eukprot:Gregarina_sp_Pseudo_9__5695@NODE_814_length_2176_cov_6_227890_g765_i0_p4_GENE_NODE_814_length_2176_cov_6_227890_g765_i0NODE_814_length_2176_cov_6_227890_g765_i0_p4_ORF_typecomplete_len140_score23_68_NODE_814_length_2176_cov_6_227890_g765_i019438
MARRCCVAPATPACVPIASCVWVLASAVSPAAALNTQQLIEDPKNVDSKTNAEAEAIAMEMFDKEILKALLHAKSQQSNKYSPFELSLLEIQKIHVTVLAAHLLLSAGALVKYLARRWLQTVANMRVQRVLNITAPPAA